jgi:hypothetical protein
MNEKVALGASLCAASDSSVQKAIPLTPIILGFKFVRSLAHWSSTSTLQWQA